MLGRFKNVTQYIHFLGHLKGGLNIALPSHQISHHMSLITKHSPQITLHTSRHISHFKHHISHLLWKADMAQRYDNAIENYLGPLLSKKVFLFICLEQLYKSSCLSVGRQVRRLVDFLKKLPLEYQMVTKIYLEPTLLKPTLKTQ